MTVDEMITKLTELKESGNIRGDFEMRVDAFGGMRGGKSIKGISVGFDWDMNSVIIHPKTQLTIYKSPG